MIAHVDIDAFYASVAERENPTLRGRALAVCRDSRRAVILTASYEARKFGVRSAMPLYLARERCPHLLIVDPEPQAYRLASRQIFAILERDGYPFESLSLDEGYLDLGTMTAHQAERYIEGMRAEILAATQLTVSAGIGNSKVVAKIASDVAKPNGMMLVELGTEAAFLAPLPAGRLPGVGPKLDQRLREFSLQTIGELAMLDAQRAYEILGRGYASYQALARGIDPRTVRAERVRKSVSTEGTFEHDLRGDAAAFAVLREQAIELAEELDQRELRAGSIGLKIKRTDFTVRSRQTQLAEPTSDARVIFAAAQFCWRSGGFAALPLRLIGLRAANLSSGQPAQLALWDGSPRAA